MAIVGLTIVYISSGGFDVCLSSKNILLIVLYYNTLRLCGNKIVCVNGLLIETLEIC